jgi:hypothetical protein
MLACHHNKSVCGVAGEVAQEHPPLGKWIIALGIRLFGPGPFGSRIGPAIAGTLTVLLVYVLARHLLRSAFGATIAAGLLAIDFLHFVESRTALLDSSPCSPLRRSFAVGWTSSRSSGQARRRSAGGGDGSIVLGVSRQVPWEELPPRANGQDGRSWQPLPV